ncbi:MAG TPA: hypothetical protein VG838_17040 [Opitutaceae bacterium]|nr:hypothetical protein [Opitutaceae bacterium]
MKPRHLLIILLGATLGIWWAADRNATARLRLQLENLRRDAADLARLRQEHERLLKAQPSDDELDRLRHRIAAANQRQADPAETVAALDEHPLQRGTWTTPAEWRNRGRDTPESILETTFWAAAGGELGALKDTFEFDDAARARAESLLARLPDSARAAYATPEDLLTLVAARDIPLSDMQWFACTQHDPDTVTESVVFRNTDGKTRQAHLTFHRSDTGWHLVVPDRAVAKMVDALTGTAPPAPEAKKAETPPPQGAEPTWRAGE